MNYKNCIVLILLVFFLQRLCAQDGSGNLEFIENKGQWDRSVRYKADISTGSFLLHGDGFSVMLQHPDDLKRIHDLGHGLLKTSHTAAKGRPAGLKVSPEDQSAADWTIRSHVYRVRFEHASEQAEIVADKPLPTYNNYFIGRDSSKWASNCRIFQGVTYRNIYPHIDLRYYTNNGVLKYDLIIHPGGDPSRIIMKYEGAEKLSLHNHQLLVRTSVGTSRELAPFSYQYSDSGRKEISCRYRLFADHAVGFNVENYAADQVLVIDPSLIFSSFTGSRADNWGFTATYGPDGSFFAGGIVQGNGFQVSPGAYQNDFRGGTWDVGIMKFSANGSKRLYGTYLGGSGNDYPHSLVVDQQGNLVVFGRTSSEGDFPTLNLVGLGGGRDIFVTKFNASGTKLIGSMRIGGIQDDGLNIEDQNESQSENTNSLVRNYGDWSRGEVILDPSGNIYVASCTQSSKRDNTGFPIIGPAFQPLFGGGALPDSQSLGQDGVILKINPACNRVLFSSFLGGSNDDAALVLDLNPANGDIYVGGATYSSNMPGVNPSVVQPRPSGGTDGFLSVISPDGSVLKSTTYLGTSGNDMIYGVKFDKLGFPYIMGTTDGNWPVLGVPGPIGAGAKQFIAKLKPDLSAFVYSTTFGRPNSRTPNISPVAFLVDRCENVYVSGWGSFYAQKEIDPYGLEGTTGMQITPDAFQSATDNRDFYFIVIKRNATGLLYGTYFGEKDNPGTISEHVDGGTSRYDKSGVIYQAICANCGAVVKFPTTPGVWAATNGSRGCNLAAVKIAFNFAGVEADPQSVINGIAGDSSGCIPLDVTFQDTKKNAKSYIWNFGDGSPDTITTSYSLTHTYGQVGIYTVRQIAIDSTTCNIRDTAYLHILARSDRAGLQFVPLKVPPCRSLAYQFNNFSVPSAGKPFNDSSFLWDFGDGTTLKAGPAAVVHSYATPGSYIVRLLLMDTNYCNYPDSSVLTLSVAALVKAQFVTPAAGCAPYNAQFQNTSVGGQQFQWDFGDGGFSSEASPSHLYPSPGTFTVKLHVVDSNTCNIVSDTSFSIIVSPKPHAAFTSTAVPLVNTPTVFFNSSTGALTYKWFFGDGDTAFRTSLDTVEHQYIRTATFQACLVAYNEYQCTDTACNPVQAIIQPLLDVPNAFTPGRFGDNGIVRVRGFGITKLIFRIYNRWGQQVFESTQQDRGWDGTFNGKPQPMDVYAYLVEAEYFDGTKASKKGDITLIR